VGNLRASRNLESISLLSRIKVVVVPVEKDTSGRRIDLKIFLPVYFVSAVEIKCQCRQTFLCSWCLLQFRIILKSVLDGFNLYRK